jgi:hypothetical protein
MTPTENPASTSPTGDRRTAGWIGLDARRSLLALRLIAGSERIVANWEVNFWLARYSGGTLNLHF